MSGGDALAKMLQSERPSYKYVDPMRWMFNTPLPSRRAGSKIFCSCALMAQTNVAGTVTAV
eukprot:CAMPEP_0172859362 /NCGR_PEP_ID=MMETSP1075-20121228/69725_1 /TAXON_ID=2916 /ORGANISM="Ceratium fusus, Strain PA161109" /LENGTH=60 /DNA_ID=CAMNT_0013707151 /DNA_START=1 /DNA_END=183 /DNA_ORIENTATION=-